MIIVGAFYRSRYTMMHECWNENPDGRPTFSALLSTVSERLENISGYLDFNCTSTDSGDPAQKQCYDHLTPTVKHTCDYLTPTIIISDEDSLSIEHY